MYKMLDCIMKRVELRSIYLLNHGLIDEFIDVIYKNLEKQCPKVYCDCYKQFIIDGMILLMQNKDK